MFISAVELNCGQYVGAFDRPVLGLGQQHTVPTQARKFRELRGRHSLLRGDCVELTSHGTPC